MLSGTNGTARTVQRSWQGGNVVVGTTTARACLVTPFEANKIRIPTQSHLPLVFGFQY